MPAKSEVSVVIPNYNNEPYIGTCLEHVLRSDPKEVIVVDDASTDGSVSIIEGFPVSLLRNDSNKGPTVSRNKGARLATGRNLLFLDGDATVERDYVPTLDRFLETHHKAGVVSGKVISEKGERMWYNFGYDASPFRDAVASVIQDQALKHWDNKLVRGVLGRLAQPFTQNFVDDRERMVDWVVEMGFMTRKGIFDSLGGLDEKFFMFYEGPDFCRRVRNLGYQVWYTPDSSLQHLGGHSHPEEDRGKMRKASKDYYYSKYPPNLVEMAITKKYLGG